MRRYIALAALLHAAGAFLAPLAPAIAKTVVFKKKDKDAGDADAEPVQINAMSKGTVVERAPAPEDHSSDDRTRINTRAQVRPQQAHDARRD